jgi:hypothetical protein
MRIPAIGLLRVLGAVTLLTSLLAPASAGAHGAPGEAEALAGPVAELAAAPPGGLDGLLLVALAAVVALGASRRRRLALALVLALLTLAFEAGLHSTHHLGDPVRAAECALAFATAHLDGAPVDAVSLAPAVDPAPDGPPLAAPAPPAAGRAAPHEGRAPPASIV